MSRYCNQKIAIRRSPDFTEIMSKIPTAFIRFGISIIFIIVVGIFIILSFIKYPETINAEATIYNSNITKMSYIHVNERDLHLIKNGQNVYIELYAYPSNKNGLIEGKLNYLDSLSYYDNGYLIPLFIDQNENRFKDLKHSQFKGKATIVISTASLFEKIFFKER